MVSCIKHQSAQSACLGVLSLCSVLFALGRNQILIALSWKPPQFLWIPLPSYFQGIQRYLRKSVSPRNLSGYLSLLWLLSLSLFPQALSLWVQERAITLHLNPSSYFWSENASHSQSEKSVVTFVCWWSEREGEQSERSRGKCSWSQVILSRVWRLLRKPQGGWCLCIPSRVHFWLNEDPQSELSASWRGSVSPLRTFYNYNQTTGRRLPWSSLQ